MAATLERLDILGIALKRFLKEPVGIAATKFLEELGYQSEKSIEAPTDPKSFWETVARPSVNTSERSALIDNWTTVHSLFQLSNDEIPSLAYGQKALITGANGYQKGMIESFVFLVIELTELDDRGLEWSRTKLAQITRELNKGFPMPAIVMFRHGPKLSIAVIDRRTSKRDASKDVLDSRRIAVIKDIVLDKPHRAHLEILNDFTFRNLDARHTPTNFRDLYEAWIKVLNVKELNKRFYNELYDWYWWSVKECEFPKGQVWEKDPGKRDDQKSVAVIRLLTRLIFVWFIKEKGLVPEDFFRHDRVRSLLKEDPCSTESRGQTTYYKAILQNLFFATLNTEQGETRKWRSVSNGYSNQHLVHSFYRYQDLFAKPEEALSLFREVPFLNGGLFECLDRELTEKDLSRDPGLLKRADKNILRIDGFSDRSDNALRVPNKLFFAHEEVVDLGENARSKSANKASGLIDIFERYKFTIEENTPIEEEVALDPELLGKVFENLLASYNEDTKSTARKQSGSFYTPREVVDYMVDETLIAHFEQAIGETEDLEPKLRELLSFGSKEQRFVEVEVDKLIGSIERLKALDPACGSGAFPMGMLQKLVHVLGKLDPNNLKWKAQNRAPLERQLKEAESIPDPTLRETKIEEAEEELKKVDISFSQKHYADYSRKLYLIEKCLFGVDIQPIAVQIAKLRFFISLAVDQRFDVKQVNGNITPLPNLETKLVAANSLIPINRPNQGSLRDGRIDDKEHELRIANERHFAARTSKTKRKYRERISHVREELADLLQADNLLTKESAKQLVHWDPFDQNLSADFFDPEWMFGFDSTQGFDIVIGNPPYVRQEAISKAFETGKPDVDPKQLLEKYYAPPKKQGKDARAVVGDVYTGTADLFVYFYARSFHLMRPGGAFAFITSNKWYRSAYGEKLRVWMSQNARIRQIIDFGDEAVFTAIAYPTIFVAAKRSDPVKKPLSTDIVKALNWEKGQDVEAFANVFWDEGFTMPQSELLSDSWQIEKPYKRELLARIRAAGSPLGEWCGDQLYYGIKTGLNEAFILEGFEKESLLTEDPTSEVVLRPLLRGRDVKRWHTEFAEQWLIKIESSENKQHPWSNMGSADAERCFAATYPGVYKRFNSNDLRQKLEARYDKGKFFWELRSCAYWEEFDKPKIFIPAIDSRVNYAFDVDAYLGNDKTSILTAEKWFVALPILNSAISQWVTRETFSEKQGGYFEFKPMYVSQIPIPPMEGVCEQVFKVICRAIIGRALASSSWELMMNGLVYEIFFPSDLHDAGIKLFDECRKLLLFHHSSPNDESYLIEEANRTASIIFKNDHPIYRMLFDLQSVPVVRIIEGKETTA